jgi:hypothetical protein
MTYSLNFLWLLRDSNIWDRVCQRLFTKVNWNICRSHKYDCLQSYTKVMNNNALGYPRQMRTIYDILTRCLKFRQFLLELLSIKFYKTPFSLLLVVTYVFIKGETTRYMRTVNFITCWEGTGVRHPQHTQTGSNYSTIASDSSDGVTNTRCCRYSCMRSWWWVEVPPETCRAVSRYK